MPLLPEVLTKPLEVKLERAGMEAEEFTVKVEKLAAVEKRLVEEAVVENRLVEVAEVVVLFPVIIKLESIVELAVERKPLRKPRVVEVETP